MLRLRGGGVMMRTRRRFPNSMVCRSTSSASMEFNESSSNGRDYMSPSKSALANRLFQRKNRKFIVQDTKKRLDDHIARVTELLTSSPHFAVPEVRSSHIVGGKIPTYVAKQLNRRGLLVVREALPKPFSQRFCNELIDYALNNHIWSRPPNVYDFNWSQAQVEALMHPRMNAIVSTLNSFWHIERHSSQYGRKLQHVDMNRHTMISNGAFVGKPCSPFGPNPAMKGPGLRRWTNPLSPELYRRIFEGDYYQWDAFDATYRIPQVVNNEKSQGGGEALDADPGPFVPWHGFISLSHWPEQGQTLRIVPMLRVGVSFVLLRPFFDDVDPVNDMMLGASNNSHLEITKEFHGQLLNALVPLPPLYPGDAVFWHPDLIIADGDTAGGEEAAVVPVDRSYAGIFFSSMPLCAGNARYAVSGREHFLYNENEAENAFSGKATMDDLTHLGRCVFGVSGWSLDKGWPGSNWNRTNTSQIAIADHNSMLGIRHEPLPSKY